jgi:hypothetical protein
LLEQLNDSGCRCLGAGRGSGWRCCGLNFYRESSIAAVKFFFLFSIDLVAHQLVFHSHGRVSQFVVLVEEAAGELKTHHQVNVTWEEFQWIFRRLIVRVYKETTHVSWISLIR